MEPIMGPTAYEAAKAEAVEQENIIRRARVKKAYAIARMQKYYGKSTLESERIATAAEPFQLHSQPLPREE